MLQFVYGGAGSGKTSYIFDKMKSCAKEGKPVLLIVPEQQVFEAEKAVVENGIPALKAEVVGFRRLCNMIFRKFGGLCYKYIGDSAKLVVMWRTLKELDCTLAEYNGITLDNLSVLEVMQKTVEELQRCNITPADLERASERLPDNEVKLKNKLSDLAAIEFLSLEILSNDYDDPEEDLPRAVKLLDENNFFQGKQVFIDGFSRFNQREILMLKKIFEGADDTLVSVPIMPRDKREMCRFIKENNRNIRKTAADAGVKIAEDIVLDSIHHGKHPDLSYLSDNIWNIGAKFEPKNTDAVKVIRARDAFAECEAVACEIAKLTGQNGCRYNEIAVIMRDPKSYEGIIDSAFEKYDIPCFTSARVKLSMKPLIRMIRSALLVCIGNWRCEDVISYMRTGLCGLDDCECDILEEYVSTWNISGSRWYDEDAWDMNPKGFVADFDSEKLAIPEELRRKLTRPLVSLFEKTDVSSNVREYSVALYDFLVDMKIPEYLRDLENRLSVSGKLDEAQECRQIWETVMSAIDSLVTVVGTMDVSLSTYQKLLFAIFDTTDIGKIPARVDEVIIGEPKLLSGKGIKYAFLIGVNEGIFPAAGSENAIFSDADKDKLADIDIKLSDNSESFAQSELFSFYRAASIPSEALYVCYRADNNPSLAVYAVMSLFSELCEIDYSKIDPAERVRSMQSLFEYAAEIGKSDVSDRIMAQLAKNDKYKNKIQAVDMPMSEENCTILPQTADKLVGNGLNMTQARIDNYIKCPFSYYAKNILSLREEATDDFGAGDIGNFVHDVFEKFFSIAGDELLTLSKERIEEIATEVFNTYRHSIIKGQTTKRLERLFNKLSDLCTLLLCNMVDEFRQSEFKPALFELAIDNKPENISPLRIDIGDGKALTIYGRVDRVDTYEKDGEVYIRVVDYKTGSKNFSMNDIRLGLNLQMLIYLFSICATDNREFLRSIGAAHGTKLRPAGIIYYSAKSPEVDVDSPIPDSGEVFDLVRENIKRSGLLLADVDVLRAMDKTFSGLYIPVAVNKDGSIRKNSNVISEERFYEIRDDICDTIGKIGREIASGVANAKPIDNPHNSPDLDACKYCKMHALCRIRKNDDE